MCQQNKLLFSESLAVELTPTTFSTLTEILAHGTKMLSSASANQTGLLIVRNSLSILQVQLVHLKRAKDIDSGSGSGGAGAGSGSGTESFISNETRGVLWTLLFTTLPAALNAMNQSAKTSPIMTRLGQMIEQSFTVLAPTVSQLTSLSEYLSRATAAPSADRKDRPQPVAAEFGATYFKLLVARFATFQAGVSLVQDLHV